MSWLDDLQQRYERMWAEMDTQATEAQASINANLAAARDSLRKVQDIRERMLEGKRAHGLWRQRFRRNP